jgi:hypothetical protein
MIQPMSVIDKFAVSLGLAAVVAVVLSVYL